MGVNPIDMTRGMIGSVSMPCEKVSAKVHRSTQQCLTSLTLSQEMITPAHVENTGRDVMSNGWDDNSHRPEASFSRSSTLQDGSYRRILSEVGRNSYSSSGPTRRCRMVDDLTNETACPRACIDQERLSDHQDQVTSLLLCSQMNALETEIR